MADYVSILDHYTKDEWWQKIGAGPWKKVDCSMYPDGKPPIIFLMPSAEFQITETLVTPEEAKLRGVSDVKR